jgi:hypothetical protein
MGEQPRPNQEQEVPKNMYVENVELARQNSTKLERGVEEIQSAKYGAALLRLMKESGDNPEIVNSLNQFLDALDHQSRFGNEFKPLSPARQGEIATFIGEAAKALRWTVGQSGRPPDLKVDLSKWEIK